MPKKKVNRCDTCSRRGCSQRRVRGKLLKHKVSLIDAFNWTKAPTIDDEGNVVDCPLYLNPAEWD